MNQKLSDKQQENIFNKILSRPENTSCADCLAKGPCWASLDFGVFICLRCSGDHRSLGRHITRVRSCKQDTWTNEEIWIMESIGNKISNSYYEDNIRFGAKINQMSSDNQRMRFITDKYSKKVFSIQGQIDPIKLLYQCKDQGIPYNPPYLKQNNSNNPSPKVNSKITQNNTQQAKSNATKFNFMSKSSNDNSAKKVNNTTNHIDLFGSDNNVQEKAVKKKSFDLFGGETPPKQDTVNNKPNGFNFEMQQNNPGNMNGSSNMNNQNMMNNNINSQQAPNIMPNNNVNLLNNPNNNGMYNNTMGNMNNNNMNQGIYNNGCLQNKGVPNNMNNFNGQQNGLYGQQTGVQGGGMQNNMSNNTYGANSANQQQTGNKYAILDMVNNNGYLQNPYNAQQMMNLNNNVNLTKQVSGQSGVSGTSYGNNSAGSNNSHQLNSNTNTQMGMNNNISWN